MPGIAVVHLVRRQNGLVPVERFLASYREHSAGIEHELIILFKGFRGESGMQDHDSLLEGLPHRRLFVPDRGLDVNAYFTAAEQLDYDYFCFLNSYSRILDKGWLEKLARWIRQPDVGLAGATGSCQSIAGGYTAQQRQMNALPAVVRFRSRVAAALRDRRPGSFRGRVARLALGLVGIWRPARDFPGFPNYHLRTNAFMISRQLLQRVHLGPLRLKVSAYKFESGRNSLTNQVLKMGFKVLVVGRDGEGYEPERWHLSNTFWQSREQNLLVADNQTEAYLAAEPASRAEFAQYAWGELARPA